MSRARKILGVTFAALVLALASSSSALAASIFGRVVWGGTSSGVAGAAVVIRGPAGTVWRYTDAGGNFGYYGPDGSYSVTAHVRAGCNFYGSPTASGYAGSVYLTLPLYWAGPGC